MEELIFSVQGSAKDPYEVTSRKDGNSLSVHCTCPAGENRQQCKHRVRILRGTPDGIVSGNAEDLKVVKSWLVGTDLEAALETFVIAEEQHERAEKELLAAKKRLTKALRG